MCVSITFLSLRPHIFLSWICTLSPILFQFWMFFLISSHLRSTQPCCSVIALCLPLCSAGMAVLCCITRHHSYKHVCKPAGPWATSFKDQVWLLPLWRQMHPPNLGNGIPWDLFPPSVHRSQVINICWIIRTLLHFSLPAMPTWSNFCIFIVSICDEHIAPPVMVRCTNPTTCTLTPNHNLHSPGKKGNGGCLSPFPLKWGF